MSKIKELSLLDEDPSWFKDAVIYELHVRTFHDSDGDGVGDFRGLTEKLDYLQDLGVTALWLLPFYPSPLRDDGYDIADYTGIHPAYGNLRDFKIFLNQAHKRGLRVITELVVNHTSDQHEWFQKARRAPAGSKLRNFYVWSDTPDKYKGTRIIFKDFEASNWTLDSAAKSYYWHRFYSHQPDLNFDNPEVTKKVLQVLDFWMEMGVDGVRLDAIPYLCEREGTNCENLPETHELIKKFRGHLDKKFKNRIFLAEANQWPEDAVPYFGDGDECHMSFQFPIMPRIFMSVNLEDRFPLIDILQQTPAIPENCQWALFLRNHDELTLEMVTDEERDYMYRAYAQDPQSRINLGIRRRLSPLLGNNRRKIELMNALLFSLPGTPLIYYGDEIGMGDNIYLGDRNGVRTPMQWSSDRNAGFSRANPQKLCLPVIVDPEYHFEAVNVEAMRNNPHSLLWWMKRLIALRKRFKAFGRGTLNFLEPKNRKILAFIRAFENENILVVANLSRYVQYVELNLSEFKGMQPVELFGRTDFPLIGELPYLLTLGPHSFYWFQIKPVASQVTQTDAQAKTLPHISVLDSWDEVLQGKGQHSLELILPDHLKLRRWFGAKGRVIQLVEILDSIPVPNKNPLAYMLIIRVRYTEGQPEIYCLPVSFIPKSGDSTPPDLPAAIASLKLKEMGTEGWLMDAMSNPGFARLLAESIPQGRSFQGRAGQISTNGTRASTRIKKISLENLEIRMMKTEQTNSSIAYGDQFILKLYRRIEGGIQPDLEIGRYLTEKRHYTNIPQVEGYLEYRLGKGETYTLALLQQFVKNQGDAWQYTLDSLGGYYEQVLTRPPEAEVPQVTNLSILALSLQPTPELAMGLFGPYLESARLLGQRTGELHLELASGSDDPNFSPEPLTPFYRRSLYQSLRNIVNSNFKLLRENQTALPDNTREQARKALSLEKTCLKHFEDIVKRNLNATRIRCHGDFHLGQVLYTGNDFVFIDFEGEPARSLSYRRQKRLPLQDVAGMLRSFHYASSAALFQQEARGVIQPGSTALIPWGDFWHKMVSAVYLKAYLEKFSLSGILPSKTEDLELLLKVFLLEKAIYELGYEINNRPNWVNIPLTGLLQILESG